jgi:hypothetical protein
MRAATSQSLFDILLKSKLLHSSDLVKAHPPLRNVRVRPLSNGPKPASGTKANASHAPELRPEMSRRPVRNSAELKEAQGQKRDQ